MIANPPAVEAHGLVKRFGDTEALRGIDLTVAPGTVLGLLGPNGAGKTTAVRILTTLLRPDGGPATVDGVDVVADPRSVRARIGLTGPVRRGRRAAHRLREPRARRPAVPPADARGPSAGPRAARAVRPERRRRPDGQGLLRRHATAARHRRQPHLAPRRAVPRRAHHRARPPQPHRDVGGHRRAGRRRHHDPAHHPVPRRGRAPGRRDRGHRPRDGHRRGQRRRAQGPARRRPPRGHPRRRRTPSTGPLELLAGALRQRAPVDRPRRPHRHRRGHRLRARSSRTRCGSSTTRASTSHDVVVRRPTLDDVFLQLTGHTAESDDDDPDTRPTRQERTDDHRHDQRVPGHGRHLRSRPHPRGPRRPRLGVARQLDRGDAPPAHRAPQPRPADLRHHPADHVRAAVQLRVRRRDRCHPRLQRLHPVPAARRVRPDRAVRLGLHRHRRRRGHDQGHHRPPPLAAHVPAGGARSGGPSPTSCATCSPSW